MNYNRLKADNPEKYPAKLGAAWKEEDIKQLLEDIKNKLSHEEIANKHERTIGGIRSRIRELAADYYFNNELSVDKIQKYTGISLEEIADSISKRQWRMDNRKTPSVKKDVVVIPTSTSAPIISTDSSELKEMLVVLKDIQNMMNQFLDGNYIKVKKVKLSPSTSPGIP